MFIKSTITHPFRKKTLGRIRLLGICISLFLTLIFSGLVFEVEAQQAGKATVKGKVTDAKTKEELTGATVKLKGTYYGASAGIDGSYTIRNVSPGEYTIEVSLVGYTPVQKTGVKLKADEAFVFDIALKEASVTTEEVVVLGERPLLDIEQASTSRVVRKDFIESSAARDVKQLAATQVGVTQTPFGLFIRGGRSYETGFVVDGISAQDPLAGTGFGLDLSSKAMKEMEVITGGGGAEYGEAPAGVVAIKLEEGTNTFKASFEHRRDNVILANFDNPVPPNNFNRTQFGWNTSAFETVFSGPIVEDKLFFFTSLSANFSDEFMQNPSSQLKSSLVTSDFWMPFNDNRWSGLLKMTWKATAEDKLTFTASRSLNVNQNTQMLQITGNDLQLAPGYQYRFLLNPQNANTYTHDTQLFALQWGHAFSPYTVLNVSFSRLFVRLRADAGGRPWRPDFINEELDPQSLIRDIEYFNPQDSVIYVLPPDGFVNSGISTLWHDHHAEDYTLKAELFYNSTDQINRFTFGFEHKFNDYQWVDIVSPWVGAPLAPGEPSRSLGASSDIWAVQPMQGAFYLSDKISYKGLIATVGLRLQYWFPGKFLDDAVADPNSPVPDGFREEYYKVTGSLFGSRYQLRLLPKFNVSFPVSDNQVLYLNYSHSSRLPHPRFVYRGLDSRFINNSIGEPIGNPALQPETTVSYELGLKNQFSADDILTLTAFYNDRFDFIFPRVIAYTDKRTGNTSQRSIQVNQDYARTRGFEVSYQKRIGQWFNGSISFAYQIATGKSNSAEEGVAQIIAQGDDRDDREFPLAWDRPFDIKASALFMHRDTEGLFGIDALNYLKFFISAQYSSGLRYTPHQFVGYLDNNPNGRPLYEPDPTQPNGAVGSPWFWVDMNLEKEIPMGSLKGRLMLQIKNALNNRNSAIVNPVTGRAYEFGDPLPRTVRDPAYPDVQDRGVLPFNPARYLAPTQIIFGFAVDI
ncbi:MAG: TonB-dependent receptor [Chloroherpetonaceae bacterium]|nr:TonB-dependent receptor [Chloroherpetonaceae bacterium]